MLVPRGVVLHAVQHEPRLRELLLERSHLVDEAVALRLEVAVRAAERVVLVPALGDKGAPRVAVLGAAGGVGLAAVELGKAMGARVIAAASNPEKLAIAQQAGADELIDYSDGDLKDKVKALTGGKGADVIYDPVGGPLFDQCMRCINWEGRILIVGFVGGDIPRVPTNLILLKSCQVVGVFYGAFSGRFPTENEQNFAELLQMFEAGKLQALVGAEYALADFVDALNCLSKRRAVGKIVVTI